MAIAHFNFILFQLFHPSIHPSIHPQKNWNAWKCQPYRLSIMLGWFHWNFLNVTAYLLYSVMRGAGKAKHVFGTISRRGNFLKYLSSHLPYFTTNWRWLTLAWALPGIHLLMANVHNCTVTMSYRLLQKPAISSLLLVFCKASTCF